MNRKLIRQSQNDTSISLLPQRLQKKIADKALDGLENQQCAAADDEIHGVENETTVWKYTNAHGSSNRHVESHGATKRMQQKKVAACSPGILRLNGMTKSATKKQNIREPSSGVVTETSLARKSANNPTTAIPGILRLNTTDCKAYGDGHTEKSKRTTAVGVQENMQKVLKPKNELREGEQLMLGNFPPSPARVFMAGKYPPWFENTQLALYNKDLRQLYDTLTGLMQRNAVLEHWSYVTETRNQLLDIFKQILLQHLKLCCEMKCDNFFWKLLFYNLREHLKYTKTKLAHICLVELLTDGIAYYKDLNNSLQGKYLMSQQQQQQQQQRSQTQKAEKFEFIAKVAAQKLLICLGDLYRYKAIQMNVFDFSEAAQCYQEAQLLIPSNGIPYNQLAIVAIHNRKKFEAIYLHMRSLMSSNEIQSARESLLVLFDEIRKKYEKTEPKVSPIHQYKNSNNTTNSNGNNMKITSPLRKEVWIHPDGVRRLHRTDVQRQRRTSKPAKAVEQRLDEMPAEDLQSRFISIYLYMIGKLYTGIGMETIQAHQSKLLAQLNALLKRNTQPLLISRQKMLKIVALNIFVLHHNVRKDKRREILYYTFTFCNQIFGVLLKKCNQLLETFFNNSKMNDQNLAAFEGLTDLNTLCQFIKTYCDYLALNVDIWEPIRNEEQYFIDPWLELQNLFINLEKVTFNTTAIDTDVLPVADVMLEENQFFYGFIPLTKLQPKHFYAQTETSSEMAQFFTRITHIKQFQTKYLEHIERLQTEDNDADSSFVLEELNNDIKTALETLHNVVGNASKHDVVTETIKLDGNDSIKQKSLQKETIQTEMQAETTDNNIAVPDLQVVQLNKLKKELEQQTNAKRLYDAKLEEILTFVDTKIYIEVRPKYLLPDTNCFIDFLDDFEQLLRNYKRYTLVIPLTVVRELDGLSKGVKLESKSYAMQQQRIHHFDDVSTNAKRSLDFIKNAKHNVKCVTTKGSMINASLFALVEEEYMSNDDRILATALALSKTMSHTTSKDDKCFIQTELVLITTDRNLRVKALSRNLAVSELNEFLLWARDCNPS